MEYYVYIYFVLHNIPVNITKHVNDKQLLHSITYIKQCTQKGLHKDIHRG